MYFKNLFALAIAAGGIAAALEVKGYESDDKSLVGCTIGGIGILGKCGKCASSIYECASASDEKKKDICLKDIGSFAGDCGGCAVNILDCVVPA